MDQLAGSNMLRTLKHQVFHQMRKAAVARGLDAAAHVVNQRHPDQRNALVGLNHNPQPIRQRCLFDVHHANA